MQSFESLYRLFEDYRHKHAPSAEPDELYEPIRYILNLGGKRIRPVLTLAGCALFNGNVRHALPAAYAVELFHNFTLLHDDIMDNARLRRHKPTAHLKFGIPRAILSGDVTLIYAYKFLSQLPQKYIQPSFALFNSTAIKVCEGQQFDMNFQHRQRITISDYLKMIEYKTAVLLACSLKLGAVVADASEKDARLLYEFGRKIGICFQLMDDLLDAFGDEKKLGKTIGGDIAENKKTFLLLKAMEQAKGKTKQKLLFCLTNNVPVEEKVSCVLNIYHQLNIRQITLHEITRLHKQALQHLSRIQAPEKNKAPLRSFAEALLTRQS
ncbi:MAG: isoprenyl synthetase [Chitinophagales bacterium]|nr:MAG: isoprenyl synthetase [Chitinophagales bacterium]